MNDPIWVMRGRIYDFTTKKAQGITAAHVIVKAGFMHRNFKLIFKLLIKDDTFL